jgi:hypothetical protein
VRVDDLASNIYQTLAAGAALFCISVDFTVATPFVEEGG